MKRLIALSAMALQLIGCVKDITETAGHAMSFSFHVTDRAIQTDSRSILPESAEFEDAIYNVTCMIYDSDTGLLRTAHHTAGKTYSVNLPLGKQYNLYAFANMGDLAAAAPLEEKDIPNLKYTIPSFEDLKSSGLPMSASISFSGETTSVPVRLRRLVSKIIFSVDNSDMESAGDSKGLAGGCLKVHRAARTLYPFAEGGSAAQNSDDIFPAAADYQETENYPAMLSEDLILYIPENRQKEAPYDRNNPLSTYISFEGRKADSVDGVGGNLTYRFFLQGENADNPGLEGGKQYRITLSLTWEGLFTKGNWTVEKEEWSDKRMILLSSNPDGPFSKTSLSIPLPPGIKEYPFYVHYSIKGDPSESGIYEHKSYGWTFNALGYAESERKSEITLQGGVKCGFSADSPEWSRYCVSIPDNQSLTGASRVLNFHTIDMRHSIFLNIKISEPSIEIDRKKILCNFDEYSSSYGFSISVTGGNVPKEYISVSSDNPLLHIENYDSSSGSVRCYWSSINSSDIPREATLRFSGLRAEASCTIRQNSRQSLSIETEENAGEGNIEY